DGLVEMLVTDLDCDIDIYVLDASCAPSSGCLAESVLASSVDDGIAFDCLAGETYYIVIEGWGFTFPGWYTYIYAPSTPQVGYCHPETPGVYGGYTLQFQPGDPATSGCV